MLPRLKEYRNELQDLRKQFERAQHSINPNAARELLGDDDFGTSNEHRALFGGQNETAALMESSNDLILQATRETLEIEDVAMQVMSDLSDQRSVMEKFKDRLNDINESLDTAGKKMQEIMKRLCGNKAMMVIVMLLLIGGIIAIIWLRFFPPWTGVAGEGSNVTTTMATARGIRATLEPKNS
jgi:hypothetical protein